ncbi:hypothetical protein [Streptomyces sp. NPDC046985]|uniref:hypothetical protein n=1 Tax=Streptomyces sp. NPDC046985 TaxID=3155377 RepID=UPI0033C6FC2B
MNPLDMLIRQYAAPVMKAAGFTKKGRKFRLTAPNGDCALLEFDTHAVDPEKFVFDVTFFMVPLSHWEFTYRQYRQSDEMHAPDASGALARCPVMPPPDVAWWPDEGMPFRSRWAFSEPETRDVCGQRLARVLADEAIPRVVRLLDRRALLEEILTAPDGDLMRIRSRRMTEIILRIDDDPVADLTALLDGTEVNDWDKPIIIWARERLSQRAAEE